MVVVSLQLTISLNEAVNIFSVHRCNIYPVPRVGTMENPSTFYLLVSSLFRTN